ncbi:TorF family putative porin [Pseudomonas sp. QE6]|uniref:TorF family putative porin n=1 Tax=Pseudomonas sp. QE6 TaxID=3242491 RepID=UPI003528ABE2
MNRPQWLIGALLSCAPLTSTLAVELNQDFLLQIDAALVSDYRTRGISQTQGDPAAQFGLTLQHISGLYVGAWTSNVDYGYGYDTRQEVDYYAGYYWQANDDVALDLGYIKYTYPKSSEFNQSDVYAILHAYGFEAGVYYGNDYPNYFGDRNSNLYSYLAYNAELPAEFKLRTRFGHNDAKDPLYLSGSGDTRDGYNEWEVKLSHELVGLDWSLSYIDTDLSQNECFNNQGYKDVCTATVVAGVSKTF